MSQYEVTLIPGDGIGLEVAPATQKVLEATGVSIHWDIVNAGMDEFKRSGNALPQEVLDSIKRTKVALKGPTNTPKDGSFSSINVLLRRIFKAAANVRPIHSFQIGHLIPEKKIDLVIFRENTEDSYVGEERLLYGGVDGQEIIGAESISRITVKACEYLFRAAFEYARRNGRKKVTAMHKGNILQMTHGKILLDAGAKVAKEYPDVNYEEVIADALFMKMILDANQFDVIATTNMFGDLLSDAAAGLVGGLGLAPGANIGKEFAIFEAVHGTAPDIAGQNKANPCALILSGALMLRHLGELEAAKKIERAVTDIVAAGRILTGDLARLTGVKPSSTTEMTDFICRLIRSY